MLHLLTEPLECCWLQKALSRLPAIRAGGCKYIPQAVELGFRLITFPICSSLKPRFFLFLRAAFRLLSKELRRLGRKKKLRDLRLSKCLFYAIARGAYQFKEAFGIQEVCLEGRRPFCRIEHWHYVLTARTILSFIYVSLCSFCFYNAFTKYFLL